MESLNFNISSMKNSLKLARSDTEKKNHRYIVVPEKEKYSGRRRRRIWWVFRRMTEFGLKKGKNGLISDLGWLCSKICSLKPRIPFDQTNNERKKKKCFLLFLSD